MNLRWTDLLLHESPLDFVFTCTISSAACCKTDLCLICLSDRFGSSRAVLRSATAAIYPVDTLFPADQVCSRRLGGNDRLQRRLPIRRTPNNNDNSCYHSKTQFWRGRRQGLTVVFQFCLQFVKQAVNLSVNPWTWPGFSVCDLRHDLLSFFLFTILM